MSNTNTNTQIIPKPKLYLIQSEQELGLVFEKYAFSELELAKAYLITKIADTYKNDLMLELYTLFSGLSDSWIIYDFDCQDFDNFEEARGKTIYFLIAYHDISEEPKYHAYISKDRAMEDLWLHYCSSGTEVNEHDKHTCFTNGFIEDYGYTIEATLCDFQDFFNEDGSVKII